MSASSEPLVSIGLPLFNGSQTLAVAIRSVLLQTYRNWELIMVDDGSTDGTKEVARSFHDPRVKFVDGAVNRGLPFRLNELVERSTGEYFARMDQDDVAYPGRIERQLRFLQAEKTIDLVGCRVIVFRGHGQALGARGGAKTSHEEICARPTRGFHLAHPTWMGRLKWFRSNPYSTRAEWSDDQELLLRTHTHSRFACLPEILFGYRETALSIRKSFLYRRSFSRSLVRYAVKRRAPAFLLGVFGQALKFGVDSVAILSGLNYTLLRHRATAATEAELVEWRRVWSMCSTEDGGH